MEKWAIITRDKEKMQEFFDVIRKEHEQEFVKVGSFSDDNFRLEIYKSFVLYWIPNLFTFINLKYDKEKVFGILQKIPCNSYRYMV